MPKANLMETYRLQEFEKAALPYRDELTRTACAMLRNHAETKDIVQEVYLQAWKSFDRFTLGTNCRAWLHKILFHVVSHHRRNWMNKGAAQRDLDAVQDLLQYAPPVNPHLVDEEILQAVRMLPREYGEVVLLADVYELSYKEIGSRLGIPLGTVMSRLSRGRSRLRTQLSHYASH